MSKTWERLGKRCSLLDERVIGKGGTLSCHIASGDSRL